MTGPHRPRWPNRVLAVAVGVVTWAAVALIALDAFARYAQAWNVVGLVAVVLLAAWGWWFGERRARRHEPDDGPDQSAAG